MKNKKYLLALILLINGCDIIYNPSSNNNNNNNITNEVEHFRSQIDRTKLIYTSYPENDKTKDIIELEIFELNDTHGAYNDENNITGIARVKTCIENNCEDYNLAVKIANGDMMQGTAFSNLFLGEPAVIALNEMNFDCYVIGNHEFDWGLDKLRIYKDNDLSNGELNAPFLGANIVDENGSRPDFIEPYTIVKKGDLDVGIIGIIGDGLESSISERSLNGYYFLDTVETVTKYCNELKEKNVDVIILANHAHPVDSETNLNKNQEYVDQNDIDCIINGHDHRKVSEVVTRYDNVKIPVIESNTKNISIGKVTLNINSENKMSQYKSIEHFYPSSYEKDENLDKLMASLYEIIDTYINEEIGYKSGGFTKEEIASSTCEYIASKYKADLVFTNTGGVRSVINNSSITYSNVYEVFPFDNELYTCELLGSELKKMISSSYMTNYYYNMTGLGNSNQYHYSDVIDSKTYKIVTVDYVCFKNYMKSYFDEKHNVCNTNDYVRICAVENIKQNYAKNI